LAHSCELNAVIRTPILWQRRGMVRSAALRRWALSLLKACSIGLRSGEYFGRSTSLARGASMGFWTATPLWAGRLSMVTMSPRLSVGARHWAVEARKPVLVIGPAATKWADILSWLSPATKVI